MAGDGRRGSFGGDNCRQMPQGNTIVQEVNIKVQDNFGAPANNQPPGAGKNAEVGEFNVVVVAKVGQSGQILRWNGKHHAFLSL